MLWHGTRNIKPQQIALGEVGLNIVYSADGMWGNGIYFAQNASYSCPGYSYAVPN